VRHFFEYTFLHFIERLYPRGYHGISMDLSEIAMTSLIQRRDPSEHTALRKSLVRADEAMRVKYDVDLGHLTALSRRELATWTDRAQGVEGVAALDVLYKMT
jgi:hypothetical protein